MKKMNNLYEAPKAEVIEVMNAGVFMGSGGSSTTGNVGGGNFGGQP